MWLRIFSRIRPWGAFSAIAPAGGSPGEILKQQQVAEWDPSGQQWVILGHLMSKL